MDNIFQGLLMSYLDVRGAFHREVPNPTPSTEPCSHPLLETEASGVCEGEGLLWRSLKTRWARRRGKAPLHTLRLTTDPWITWTQDRGTGENHSNCVEYFYVHREVFRRKMKTWRSSAFPKLICLLYKEWGTVGKWQGEEAWIGGDKLWDRGWEMWGESNGLFGLILGSGLYRFVPASVRTFRSTWSREGTLLMGIWWPAFG